MHKVCTEHLRPGMVLAKDIPGYDGSVFLAKGHALEESTLSALRAMDVGQVFIKSMGAEADQKDLLRRCDEYVFNFFVYVNPESRVFNEIYRLTLEKTLESTAPDWKLPCFKELRAENVEHLSLIHI